MDDFLNEFTGGDSKAMDKLYLLSIAHGFNDVGVKLEAISTILRARPDIMPTEVSFEINALIHDFLTGIDKLLISEVKRQVAERPELRDRLKAFGIDPDTL